MKKPNKLLDRLRLPESIGSDDLNTPEATAVHARLIAGKYYLKKIYLDWYGKIEKSLFPDLTEKIMVEIGSGGGFIKEILPQVKTSETIFVPGMDLCFTALNMPFKPNSIDAFILIDVFHHIYDCRRFFTEARNCLKPGGRIVMIEPANTLWSRFVFRRSHHEPFDLEGGWSFPPGGRMTSANSALPWIIFCRDRKLFEEEFSELKIRVLKPFMPFLYLISGGVSMRQLLPSFTYPAAKAMETMLTPFNHYLGMFLSILLEKSSGKGEIGE
ncbi:MAG: methyltransferase domain-containing protein [Candidatus Aminicenantes bacterium]|nr:methyltransferase domain-containing protein [Candidatus Aminicenantes bacterium]